MKLLRPLPEALEARIAPAAVFTYTDIDGDFVTIKTSKGSNADLAAAGVLTFSTGGALEPRQLQRIDLSLNGIFAGTDLMVTAKRGPDGDGLVNVGAIDASAADGGTALDLGKITIKGDLAQIDAGDATVTAASPAMKLLSVRSMGNFGLVTQGAVGDLTSDVSGSIPALKVASDLRGVYLHLVGGAPGAEAAFGSVTIGGSLIGGAANNSGKLESLGFGGVMKIGGSLLGGAGERSGSLALSRGAIALTIGGNLQGGVGFASGAINSSFDSLKIGGSMVGSEGIYSGSYTSGGDVGSISIRGSILGGKGAYSAAIVHGGNIGAVTVGGNLEGGDGDISGTINTPSGMASVTIAGSVVGGSRIATGAIYAGDALGPVKIGGDLIGGNIKGTESGTSLTGYISGGSIASVFLGGSVIAGTDTSSAGALTTNASIRADHHIGPITIKGSVIGNESTGGITYPTITARGQEMLAAGATSDLAIKSLTIGGRVEFARVLAGFDIDDLTNAGSNGNASIGAVKVGGDWFASSISAGVQDGSSNGFGDASNAVINTPPGAATDAIVARIASITIKGAVIGVPNPLFQTGFLAQQIGSFKMGAYTAQLTAGTDGPILLTPYTANVTLRELP